MSLDIALVGRRPEYIPWVCNSWILSGEHGAPWRTDRRVWTTYEHSLIERYWKDPNFLWLVAANPKDTNYCYGYLCGELTDVGPILHYLYVRRSMRDSKALQLGVAETLLRAFIPANCDRVTHTRTTPAWDNLLADNPRVRGLAGEWFANPYLSFDQFAPWRSEKILPGNR